ncbi:MAG: peptide chain release factor 3 [Candidatus Sericytochromatia bacterium]|nr:MAG: peptide chain release factor 3 [Candidatus Sericytochromatia bacterium]
MSLIEEINKRRTFAIISHPDAGKTTLTEKLLLYGGAIHEAGSVTARKNQRKSTSDWMELERKRGISITSTVLQFQYNGYNINLLDTPGHEDFSEDTYRILTAVDAVIMVIDGAKGIEAQTKKLFQVCSQRNIPIFTFINKLDRPIKEPLSLLDEIEKVLGIGTFCVNWALGSGTDFRGIYDRLSKQVYLFEKVSGGIYKAPVSIHSIEDEFVKNILGENLYPIILEELQILDIAGENFNIAEVEKGKITPVFFGSAYNNFGVQLLLDYFLKYSLPPGPHYTEKGKLINPDYEKFSGFIFKIQANMDPKHRDRIAFLRVCSGKFTRNMIVNHFGSGKKIRLSSAHSVLGQQRETLEEAYPGDIVGLISNGNLSIGDTLTEDNEIIYNEIPQFAPEIFFIVSNPNPSNYKPFKDGIEQLLQEGVVQAFELMFNYEGNTLLGAVGQLQFEVFQYRLKNEYNSESTLTPTNWSLLRWIINDVKEEKLNQKSLPIGAALGKDRKGRFVILFPSKWSLDNFLEKKSDFKLSEVPK